MYINRVYSLLNIKMIIITYTLLCLLCGALYSLYKQYIHKPKIYEHLPSATLFECIKYGLSDLPSDIKIQKLSIEELHKNKLQVIWRNGHWLVGISSMEEVRKIFKDTSTFIKPLLSEIKPNILFSKFMGANLIFSNHEVWKRFRKVLNPPFKKQFEIEIFSDCVNNFFSVVDNKLHGKSIDIYKYMQRITMDAMGKGIMGVDFNSIIREEVPLITHYNNVIKNSSIPFYLIFDILDNKFNPFRTEAYNELEALEAEFQNILDNKRKEIKQKSIDSNVNDDILSLMLKAQDLEEVKFTDKEIRDNIMGFLLAGHDTTAFAMSAALHFIAKYPKVQDKLRKEIMDAMEIKQLNSNENLCPTIDQVKRMKYLSAVIKESMRLYPSVPGSPFRKNVCDVKIGNYHLPANSKIYISIYAMQRDPEYFEDPESFIPERFMDENNSSDPLAWCPFGGGTRACIGINFSLLEQKCVLSMILLKYLVKYPSYKNNEDFQFLLTRNLMPTPKNFYLDFELLK